MKQVSRERFLLAGGLLAVASLTGCGTQAPARTAAAGLEPAPVPRQVRVTAPVPATTGASYPSSLYLEHDVMVTARATGVIEKVLVDRGNRVTAGQALAILETDLAAHEMELAEQDLRLAQAEFERSRSLHAERIISPQEFQRAEIARDQARSRRDLAAARLERCTVRAPFDGTIGERWAIVGQRVVEDDSVPLFRLLGRDPLRARADVPEARLPGLAAGGEAWIETDGAAPQAARIVFVSPAVDAASGTAPVVVEAAPRGAGLRPGAAVRVRFEAGLSPGAAAQVPRSAFAGAAAPGDEIDLLVAEAGRAVSRRVRVLEADGVTLTVSGLLRPDDRVILGPSPGLSPGDPVEAILDAG